MKPDPVFHQELKGRHVFFSPDPHKVPVVKLGLGHQVSGVVEEDLVHRVLDAILLLKAGAAAERKSAAAQHCVAADIVVFIHRNHIGAEVASHDCSGKARGTRTNHDNVSDMIPGNFC